MRGLSSWGNTHTKRQTLKNGRTWDFLKTDFETVFMLHFLQVTSAERCTSSPLTEGVVRPVRVSPLDRLHFLLPPETEQPLVWFGSASWSHARLQRCWPASAAVLLTGPIKVSVTKPDVPVTSAGQVLHVSSVSPAIESGDGPWLMLCALFCLYRCGFWVNVDVVWLCVVCKTCDCLWLILAPYTICGQKCCYYCDCESRFAATCVFEVVCWMCKFFCRISKCSKRVWLRDRGYAYFCKNQSLLVDVFYCLSQRSVCKQGFGRTWGLFLGFPGDYTQDFPDAQLCSFSLRVVIVTYFCWFRSSRCSGKRISWASDYLKTCLRQEFKITLEKEPRQLYRN